MLNITKTALGFIFRNTPFSFESFVDKDGNTVTNSTYNTSQLIVGTDRGIIFFDLSVTIEGVTYGTSSNWATALFS